MDANLSAMILEMILNLKLDSAKLKMTLCLSVISDIVPPKLNWQIKVRIPSLWKVHSWNDHNTITSLEMILIDEKMNTYLTDNGYDKSVIVILQLSIHGISNAFNGTRIFINSNLKESLEYKEKLENGNKSSNQMISYVSSQSNNVSMDDFLKHPKMTIFEVLQCSKVSTVVVLAKTIDFDHTKKWYYQACNQMFKECTYKKWRFRIKIHVQVADVSGSSTFILFDRVATQELENPSLNLFEDNNDVTLWPAVFNSLLDKTMLFKIHVSDGNIEKKWQSYTVVKITTDQNLIDQFKMKHDIHDMNDNDEIDQVSNNHTEVEDNLSKESVAEEFNQAYDKVSI
ncbi:uncharacterized protein LOC131613995 [Vicia villosa]|uniref:uncharacterized protein LOC131613995 n=1 Tax=Vicia villosa TaxID=3911 RepID=UPI00273B1EC1|nr:uncharacterized protein LOC131613995 [Vicia villosa]